MLAAYYRRVLTEAWKETWPWLRGHLLHLTSLGVLGVIITHSLRLCFSGPGDAGSRLRPDAWSLLGGAGAVLIVGTGLLLLNLLRAPAGLDAQLRSEGDSLINRLKAIADRTPRLEPESCLIRRRKLWSSGRFKPTLVAEPFFGTVSISNPPRPPAEVQTALAVHAGLRFRKAGGPILLFEIQGNWVDEREREGRAFLQVAFEGNGLPRSLDVVIKHESDGKCYAYNAESRDTDEADLGRVPAFALDPGEYEVDVSLQGINVQCTFTLGLRNPGLGRTPELWLLTTDATAPSQA